MKPVHMFLPCLLALAACSAPPEVLSKRVRTVDGNALEVTSGTIGGQRFVRMEKDPLAPWAGRFKGGDKQWHARADMLYDESIAEMRRTCGEWFYELRHGPLYGMMDKDDTMGGMAPVLGITAAMAAHLAAASATDAANVPVSIYIEFRCRRDAQ